MCWNYYCKWEPRYGCNSYDQYLCSVGWNTPSYPKMMNLLHNCDSTSLYIYVCLLEEKWCQSCTCGLWKMMGLAVWPFQFLKAFVFIFFPQFSFLFFPVEPEIQVDKVWVHADVSVEVEISCIVHAEPMAEVSNDTYDKCTLYQGYGNRYNLIRCWHIFQQQCTIVRTATGSRKKSWKVNWQKIFQILTKSENFDYFTKATWSIRIIPVYKAL